MGGKPPNTEDKFWAMSRRTETGCREWLGKCNPKGYGVWTWKGKNIRANRLAWMLTNKRLIPDGLVIMHKCDNRCCVEPSHLKLGTTRENNLDMIAKGRNLSGYKVWLQKRYAALEAISKNEQEKVATT